jgi:hypothetical protein
MKNARACKGVLNDKGVTTLEMLVTAVIFMLFLTSVASVWVSYSKWLSYLNQRMDLYNEVMVARAFLVSDLQGENSVVANPPQGWVINPAGPTLPPVSYWAQGKLLMMSQGAIGYNFPAAYDLSGAQFSTGGRWTAAVVLNFQKSSQTRSLEVDLQEIPQGN